MARSATGTASCVNGAPGISLVETMIVLMLLAMCALALASSLLTSLASTTSTDEHAAAMRQARVMLETLTGGRSRLVSGNPPAVVEFDKLKAAFPNGVITGEFSVQLDDDLNTHDLPVPDTWGCPSGEWMIVLNETITRDQLGVDRDHDGKPDGVMFEGLPFNCDLNATADVFTASPVRAPAGVIVRWMNKGREERVELWTVIDFLQTK